MRFGVGAGLRLLAALGLLASVPLLAVDGRAATGPAAAGDVFSFNWSGRPSAPQPWVPQGWDVIVHSRDARTWQALDPMPAQHGADCGAPPATHLVTRYEDAVFICNNHMMTAFMPGGYGEVEMAPDHLVDWSQGTAIISWHQSTYRTSPRDWTDINVTPFADNLVLPANVTVDLSGEPRNGVHIAMSTAFPTTFSGSILNDFNATPLAGTGAVLEHVLPPSMTVRAHFQLEISRTHIRFGLPDQNVWFVDQDAPALPFTSGIVQLGHHSYTPDKECTPTPGALTCTGDTWHWSDFSMQPAHPFTMMPADTGSHVSHDTSSTVHFTVGAPAGSFLRFAAVGAITVSYDGGKTWREPKVQPATSNRDGVVRGSLFNGYWTPVPEGTTTVMFDGQDTYFSPWWVKDVAIWSTADPANLQTGDARLAGPRSAPAPHQGGTTAADKPTAPPRVVAVLRSVRRYGGRYLPVGDDYLGFILVGALAMTCVALGFQLGSRRRRKRR